MDMDSSLIMTVLTVTTGLIMATDRWFFRSRERGHIPFLVSVSSWTFPLLAVVFVVRSFVIEAYEIPSESMQPELRPGDFIAVSKSAYGVRLPIFGINLIPTGEPQRGDVIVFRYPPHPSTVFIKRVIGIPGDTLRYEHGKLYLNEQLVEVSAIKDGWIETIDGRHHPLSMGDGLSAGTRWTATVAPGQYFVLGDNRDQSKDSRFWGTVPEANLLGKAVRIILRHDSKGTSLVHNGSII